LNHPELRRSMVAWAENGGRILVEGGEVAYAATKPEFGFPEVVTKVLHINDYLGDDSATMFPSPTYQDHYLVNRPHGLPHPFIIDNSGGMDWGACDLVSRADDAEVILQTAYGSNFGGVVVHDDNTCPEGGQTVFFPFNLMKAIDEDGRAILDNALTYLLQKEPAGHSSISGKAKRIGQTDHSGIVVRAGQLHSAVTAADGTYTIDGLWGGDYRITADDQGYAPEFVDLTLQDDSTYPGVNLYLSPVLDVAYPDEVDLDIPDNDADGITRTVQVQESGELVGIEIDGDISHFAVGHLLITLTSPQGTEVTLHNRTGGTADDLVGTWPISLFVDGPGQLEDFLGQDPSGEWQFQVIDQQFGASGTFNSWSLNLLVKSSQAAPADDSLPGPTRLLGNTPNPFNPQTNISFALSAPAKVNLAIYDIKGRLVRPLAKREFTAGQHTVLWNGKDNHGSQPASGVYFCRLQTGATTQVHKMMLVR